MVSEKDREKAISLIEEGMNYEEISDPEKIALYNGSFKNSIYSLLFFIIIFLIIGYFFYVIV